MMNRSVSSYENDSLYCNVVTYSLIYSCRQILSVSAVVTYSLIYSCSLLRYISWTRNQSSNQIYRIEKINGGKKPGMEDGCNCYADEHYLPTLFYSIDMSYHVTSDSKAIGMSIKKM